MFLAVYTGAVLSVNLNVLVVQLFLKVPALNALAPTQSEPPFQLTQLAAFLVFAVLGAASLVGFQLPKTEERMS